MRSPARPAWGTLALLAFASVVPIVVACGSQQFGVRKDHGPSAFTSSASSASSDPFNGAPNATASGTTVAIPASPSSTGSDSPAASSSAAAAAKIPPRKTIIARHILIQWMGCRSADANIVRTKEQARVVAVDVLRRLKSGEEFTRLVLDFSDEPNAGRRGGSLPPFGHGTMDKAFEAAAFALAPGEISGVVETQFGFHVIQRLE